MCSTVRGLIWVFFNRPSNLRHFLPRDKSREDGFRTGVGVASWPSWRRGPRGPSPLARLYHQHPLPVCWLEHEHSITVIVYLRMLATAGHQRFQLQVASRPMSRMPTWRPYISIASGSYILDHHTRHMQYIFITTFISSPRASLVHQGSSQ